MTYFNRINEMIKPVPINTIRHLMALPPDALVRLYSYQGQEAWDAAESRGYWTGTEEAIRDDDCYNYLDAYQWIRDQMALRIPNFSGDLPMWAWTKRPSAKPKPSQYIGTSGQIRLTLLVPRSRILFSDYETWHSPLNKMLITRTEKEHDDHSVLWKDRMVDENFHLTPEYLKEIQNTWVRCLEFEPSATPEELFWTRALKYFRIQACVDRFYWNEIVGVRHFTHRQL